MEVYKAAGTPEYLSFEQTFTIEGKISRLVDQSLAQDICDCLGPVAGSKLFQNMPKVRLDSPFGKDELGSYFPIRAAARQFEEGIQFSWSQSLKLHPEAVTLLTRQMPQSFHELPGDLRVEERPPVTDRPDSRGKAADGDVLQHVAGGTGFDSLQCPAITEPVRHDNDLNRRQGLLDEACGLQAISRHVLIHQNHVWLELARKSDHVIDGFRFADHLDTFDLAQQRADPLPDKCEVICYEDSDTFVHT